MQEARRFNEWAGDMALPFEEIYIKVRDDFPIRARVFNPHAEGETLFYLPGNGYCVEHIFEANSVSASWIARYSGRRVVIIDFRLMPAVAWPIPINDCRDVIQACVQQKLILGLGADQIILGGLSGGAHASAMIALDPARGFQIQKLLLLNGPYDFTFIQNRAAADEALDYMCIRQNLGGLKQAWGLADVEMGTSEYSPLMFSDFKNFPETVIVLGEFDGIRSDSEAFYDLLFRHGVQVSKIVLPGQTHNNILFNQTCGDENDPARILAELLLNRTPAIINN